MKEMLRLLFISISAITVLALSGCATGNGSGSVHVGYGIYGCYGYPHYGYGYGGYPNRPNRPDGPGINPPRPENPVARPPTTRPGHRPTSRPSGSMGRPAGGGARGRR